MGTSDTDLKKSLPTIRENVMKVWSAMNILRLNIEYSESDEMPAERLAIIADGLDEVSEAAHFTADVIRGMPEVTAERAACKICGGKGPHAGPGHEYTP